ncbi:MAG: hypothetical protein P1U36_06395 [Legionellaceae bacterium]|nr:hypothetical protein [Legionellaceae bacterium]
MPKEPTDEFKALKAAAIAEARTTHDEFVEGLKALGIATLELDTTAKNVVTKFNQAIDAYSYTVTAVLSNARSEEGVIKAKQSLEKKASDVERFLREITQAVETLKNTAEFKALKTKVIAEANATHAGFVADLAALKGTLKDAPELDAKAGAEMAVAELEKSINDYCSFIQIIDQPALSVQTMSKSEKLLMKKVVLVKRAFGVATQAVEALNITVENTLMTQDDFSVKEPAAESIESTEVVEESDDALSKYFDKLFVDTRHRLENKIEAKIKVESSQETLKEYLKDLINTFKQEVERDLGDICSRDGSNDELGALDTRTREVLDVIEGNLDKALSTFDGYSKLFDDKQQEFETKIQAESDVTDGQKKIEDDLRKAISVSQSKLMAALGYALGVIDNFDKTLAEIQVALENDLTMLDGILDGELKNCSSVESDDLTTNEGYDTDDSDSTTSSEEYAYSEVDDDDDTEFVEHESTFDRAKNALLAQGLFSPSSLKSVEEMRQKLGIDKNKVENMKKELSERGIFREIPQPSVSPPPLPPPSPKNHTGSVRHEAPSDVETKDDELYESDQAQPKGQQQPGSETEELSFVQREIQRIDELERGKEALKVEVKDDIDLIEEESLFDDEVSTQTQATDQQQSGFVQKRVAQENALALAAAQKAAEEEAIKQQAEQGKAARQWQPPLSLPSGKKIPQAPPLPPGNKVPPPPPRSDPSVKKEDKEFDQTELLLFLKEYFFALKAHESKDNGVRAQLEKTIRLIDHDFNDTEEPSVSSRSVAQAPRVSNTPHASSTPGTSEPVAESITPLTHLELLEELDKKLGNLLQKHRGNMPADIAESLDALKAVVADSITIVKQQAKREEVHNLRGSSEDPEASRGPSSTN